MKTLWIYRKTTELVDLYHLQELTVSFVKTANEMAQTAKAGPNIQLAQTDPKHSYVRTIVYNYPPKGR